MASPNKFNSFVDDICRGNLNLGTDSINVVLTVNAPSAGWHYYSAVTGELTTGNGYTAGGAVCTTSLSAASGTDTFSCNAVTWTSNTGNMGPFRYVIYYDNSPAANKTLIVFYDYGSNITLSGTAGDTFTASPAGNVLFTLA